MYDSNYNGKNAIKFSTEFKYTKITCVLFFFFVFISSIFNSMVKTCCLDQMSTNPLIFVYIILYSENSTGSVQLILFFQMYFFVFFRMQ